MRTSPVVPFLAVLLTVTSPALAQTNPVRPGLGDDPGVPETTPFTLPAGVRMVGEIEAVDADGGECPDRDAVVGNGRGVVLCMALCRDTAWTIDEHGNVTQIPLDGGLIAISEHQEGQNALLVGRHMLPVFPNRCFGGMAGETEEQKKERRRAAFMVELRLQCLNEKRSPSFAGMGYRIGGYTTDPALKELLALLETKKLEADEDLDVVGEAVYAITEGSGLTSELRIRIARLPNKA